MRTAFARCLSLNALLLAGLGSAAFAQQPAAGAGAGEAAGRLVAIKDIGGMKVLTPEYQVKRNPLNPRVLNWYQIITSYESAPDWLDEVQFTYYVLVKNTKNPKGPPQTLFKGEVTYINVEKGKHKSDMFLHPSTIARYGEVQAMAVEVRVQGRLLAIETKPNSRERWWEQLTPVDGLLLDRSKTPFAMLYFDDYEAVKPAPR